ARAVEGGARPMPSLRSHPRVGPRRGDPPDPARRGHPHGRRRPAAGGERAQAREGGEQQGDRVAAPPGAGRPRAGARRRLRVHAPHGDELRRGRPDPHLRLPAVPRGLAGGRHLGGAAERDRRAHPGAAPRTPHRRRRPVLGGAPMSRTQTTPPLAEAHGTTDAEAAVAFGATVASALAAAGGNARTVEQYDALVERRSASDVLRDHRARLVATGLPGLLAPEDADGLGLLEEGGALAALVAVARAAGAVPGPEIAAPWAAVPTILRLAGADRTLQAQVAAGEVRLAVADLTGTSAADRTAAGTARDTVRVVDGEESEGLL